MFLIGARRAAPHGTDVPPLATPTWDVERALAALNVTEVPFDATCENMLGYARGRTIAVSPLSPLPHMTRFHELAHVLLGHTTEGEHNDDALTPRNLRECEAEAVAMRCCAALDLPGVRSSGTIHRALVGGWKDTEAVRPADSEGGRSDSRGGYIDAGGRRGSIVKRQRRASCAAVVVAGRPPLLDRAAVEAGSLDTTPLLN